jgi:hypothetical protein
MTRIYSKRCICSASNSPDARELPGARPLATCTKRRGASGVFPKDYSPGQFLTVDTGSSVEEAAPLGDAASATGLGGDCLSGV